MGTKGSNESVLDRAEAQLKELKAREPELVREIIELRNNMEAIDATREFLKRSSPLYA